MDWMKRAVALGSYRPKHVRALKPLQKDILMIVSVLVSIKEIIAKGVSIQLRAAEDGRTKAVHFREPHGCHSISPSEGGSWRIGGREQKVKGICLRVDGQLIQCFLYSSCHIFPPLMDAYGDGR